MRHTKVTYVPDCPRCGQEAGRMMRYRPGTQSEGNPFGEQELWWLCGACGWESERVSAYEFDSLTARLTAGLRGGES